MLSEKDAPDPYIHDLLMKNGAKTFKMSTGVKICYTALAQTSGFRNFNVTPGSRLIIPFHRISFLSCIGFSYGSWCLSKKKWSSQGCSCSTVKLKMTPRHAH